MNDEDKIDDNVRRLFPWALFAVLAVLFFWGALRTAHSTEMPSCEEVVARVGLKPLWIAEREAKRKYPDITQEQIAWGRKCVTDHRRAVAEGLARRAIGAFQ